jgi:hypothetical protein
MKEMPNRGLKSKKFEYGTNGGG